jgi:uncharacterized membrane protein YphA (DoxX/SURF4 family)
MSVKLAHVSYVMTPEEMTAHTGADYRFLWQPFTDPWNWLAISLSIMLILGGILAFRKVPCLRDRIRYFRGRARTYQEYLPAILRVCLGIALIGAGSQNALISPAVHNQPAFALIQVILGFFIITGFLLTPAVIGSLALASGALIFYPTLFDNLEIIGAIVAVILLNQSRPGLDDLLGVPNYSLPERLREYAPFVLRLGLGLSLIIMAIGDKFLNPHLFGYVVESYGLVQLGPFSTGMWVASATIIELVLGLAILLGLQTRIASLLTFIVLSIFFFVFKEEVYAHVTLFGCLFALLIAGSGTLSLDHLLYARRKSTT